MIDVDNEDFYTEQEAGFKRIYSDDAENYFQRRAFVIQRKQKFRNLCNLRFECHRVQNDAILSTAWDMDQGTNSNYAYVKQHFLKHCKEEGYPLHNGVAFWQYFMERNPSMERICEQDATIALLGAICSYGEVFNHALIRTFPKTLIRQGDVHPSKYNNKDYQSLLEFLQDQTKWLFFELPEFRESLVNFATFQRLWKNHLKSAKRLLDWGEEYKRSSFHSHQYSLAEARSDDALAHLFYQFVLFLNEYSNSTHKNAGKAWETYHTKEHSNLHYIMVDLAVLLKTDEAVAKVAPVYTLLFFAKNAERLCKTDKSDSGEGNMLLNIFDLKRDDRKETKVYIKERASSNIRTPKKAWVLTYQLLRSYFDKNPEQLKVEYDPALCEYILQGKCSLIGQMYYSLDDGTILDGIIKDEKWVSTTDFKESNKPLHPLICEIQKRLNQQLYVYPRDGNIVCEEPPGRYDGLYDKANKRDQEIITNGYLDICVLNPGGIGNDYLPEYMKGQFAKMLDKLATARGICFEKCNDIENLDAAFERSVCKIGAQGVFDRSFKEVTTYLYRVLYDENIASCKDIFPEEA